MEKNKSSEEIDLGYLEAFFLLSRFLKDMQ